MTLFKIFIEGDPRPQARPRAFRRNGFIKIYSEKTSWRNTVKQVSQMVYRDEPLRQPLKVHIDYYFNRPKSHYGTGRNRDKLKDSAPVYMTKKPDLDNLNKAILDALQDAGVIRDDSQIIKISASKCYNCHPLSSAGAEIKISGINIF